MSGLGVTSDLLDRVARLRSEAPATAWAASHTRRAREILASLGVADRADHFPTQLSGGQQQRVAIARALVHEPSLILADEPTASIDKQRGRQVMELFRKAASERGAAVLIVTHDHRSLDLVHRTFEIEDGTLSTDVAADLSHEPGNLPANGVSG